METGTVYREGRCQPHRCTLTLSASPCCIAFIILERQKTRLQLLDFQSLRRQRGWTPVNSALHLSSPKLFLAFTISPLSALSPRFSQKRSPILLVRGCTYKGAGLTANRAQAERTNMTQQTRRNNEDSKLAKVGMARTRQEFATRKAQVEWR